MILHQPTRPYSPRRPRLNVPPSAHLTTHTCSSPHHPYLQLTSRVCTVGSAQVLQIRGLLPQSSCRPHKTDNYHPYDSHPMQYACGVSATLARAQRPLPQLTLGWCAPLSSASPHPFYAQDGHAVTNTALGPVLSSTDAPSSTLSTPAAPRRSPKRRYREPNPYSRKLAAHSLGQLAMYLVRWLRGKEVEPSPAVARLASQHTVHALSPRLAYAEGQRLCFVHDGVWREGRVVAPPPPESAAHLICIYSGTETHERHIDLALHCADTSPNLGFGLAWLS